MKRLLDATVVIAALISAPALAADLPARMPIKAPPSTPVVEAYNWSGIYFGGDVGWSRAQQSVFWPNAAAAAPNNFDHNHDSWVGSAHVGIQGQFNNIVLGVEGSFVFRSNDWVTGSPQTGCPSVNFTCQTSVDRIWTVGPRAGVAFANWLPYATGGYANGRVRNQSFRTATGGERELNETRRGGWFAGVGVEYAFITAASYALIGGVEYKHIDLSSVRFIQATTRDLDRSRVDLVVARLSLKFGWAGPVVARY